MAKEKKIAKKDIEKFTKKVIVRYTDSIVEAVFSKIKKDPELNQEYFDICGLGDMVEEVPVKPAKKVKLVKPAKAIKAPVAKKATKTVKKAKTIKKTK